MNSPWVFTILIFLPGVVLAEEAVQHTLSFPKDRQQVILVRSEFPVITPLTELIMPNWTPGSYLIRDFAANVNRIAAVSGDGAALEVQKVSKDRWHVDTGQSETLIVDYEIFTPSLSVRDSWASREFSLINGASVFLYTPESRELPQWLDIVTDADAGAVFTAMTMTPDGQTYHAKNYDELVDSPVAVAKAPAYLFTNNDQDYVLLNVGENESWDGQQAALDVEEIVAVTQSFWRSNPLKNPYWFMNFIVEAKGGLEHDHSTVIMTGRRQMRDREKYIQWLSVVAHEFFHVWNVRNMRPVELAQYDYQKEQFTSQLWLVEGLTSYYDNLLLSRAGLIRPKEYMSLLAKDIYRLETTPGRLLRPVTEASMDTWIRQYKPNSNSVNSTISYYTKGAVIGFVLDAYLRKESKGQRDLDEVMRRMYELYSSKPYSSNAFKEVVIEVGGPRAGAFLNTLLTTTTEPDVDAALDWFGLILERGAFDGLEGDLEGRPAESTGAGLHVLWNNQEPGLVVKSVLAGSGSSVAGLMPNDEILAIGGERLTADTFDTVMSSFRPAEETNLLISRRGKVISLDIKLGTVIPDHFNIALKSGYKRSHTRRLESLLGQKLRQAPGVMSSL